MALMEPKEIIFDIDKDLIQTISANQGDTGRRIRFYLQSNSLPIDLTEYTVRIYLIKPDGTLVFNNVDVENVSRGQILVELTDQILAVHGAATCQLKIYGPSMSLINTSIFYIKIKDSLIDQVIASTNEFNVLLAALNKVNLADASPKDVFATVAELQAETTANSVEGKKYIYLVVEDGKWYYWNGSTWDAGGQYQSTGIADGSVSTSKYANNSVTKEKIEANLLSIIDNNRIFDRNWQEYMTLGGETTLGGAIAYLNGIKIPIGQIGENSYRNYNLNVEKLNTKIGDTIVCYTIVATSSNFISQGKTLAYQGGIKWSDGTVSLNCATNISIIDLGNNKRLFITEYVITKAVKEIMPFVMIKGTGVVTEEVWLNLNDLGLAIKPDNVSDYLSSGNSRVVESLISKLKSYVDTKVNNYPLYLNYPLSTVFGEGLNGAVLTDTGFSVSSGSTGAGTYKYQISTLDGWKDLDSSVVGKKIKIYMVVRHSTNSFSIKNLVYGLNLTRMVNGVSTFMTNKQTDKIVTSITPNTSIVTLEYTVDANDVRYNPYIQIPSTNTDTTAFYLDFINNKVYIDNFGSDSISQNQGIFDKTLGPMNERLKALENADSDISVVKVTVKPDGTGDYIKLTDAVDFANANANAKQEYVIAVYDGTYDIIAEKGGTIWLNSIALANGEKQGLVLDDYVHLEGHGTVNVSLEIPDEIATYVMSQCLSTLNMWKHNRVYNINFTGKNCRYAVHDESSNTYPNGTRYVKKCTFNHKGNKEGLWSSTQAYGSGTSGGGRYNFEDCIFEADGTPFSMHNNDNQSANIVSIDGCYFKNRLSGHGIGFGYLGSNTEHNRVFIKNSIYQDVYVHVESGQTGNNVWDIYNFVDKTVTIGNDA